MAANDGKEGGLQWNVKLTLLVWSVPISKGHHHKTSSISSIKSSMSNAPPEEPQVYTSPDGEVEFRTAPIMLAEGTGNVDPHDNGVGLTGRLDSVECVIPIKVIAGNTAFLVKPTLVPL